jgi:hypothetical protein
MKDRDQGSGVSGQFFGGRAAPPVDGEAIFFAPGQCEGCGCPVLRSTYCARCAEEIAALGKTYDAEDCREAAAIAARGRTEPPVQVRISPGLIRTARLLINWTTAIFVVAGVLYIGAVFWAQVLQWLGRN